MVIGKSFKRSGGPLRFRHMEKATAASCKGLAALTAVVSVLGEGRQRGPKEQWPATLPARSAARSKNTA
jgi:hypothetical protein